ncbi:MAG: hypothetical protein MJ211_13290 [Bacteroidales bacterium]|nr:hypothetical protein [Bacteroidales bacterium]
MKKIFLSAMTLSMIILTSCNGGGKTENTTNQDSLQQQVSEPKTETPKAAETSKFQKPSEDIAKLIWDKNFKSKYKDDAKIEDITITSDKSIDNVIYSYKTTEFFEYEDGGMVNSFINHSLACYQNNDGSWLVVDCFDAEGSEDMTPNYAINFYNYKDGNLNSINKNLFEIVTNKLEVLEDDKKGFGGYIENLAFEFNPTYILVIDGDKVNSLTWNGEKFDVAPATEAQYISEKDLFYKVANENNILKGKQFDFTFDGYYLELNQFMVDNYEMSYGRFKLNNGGYYIYLRSTDQNTKEQIVEKYQFIDGKLSLISNKAFFDEVGLSINDGQVMFSISNMRQVAYFYPYKDDDFDYENVKDFYWNGEKFE